MKNKLSELEARGLVVNKGEADDKPGWWIFDPKTVKNTFIPDKEFTIMTVEEIYNETKHR